MAARSPSLARRSAPYSAYESSLEALKAPTIRVVAIIAEGVPEKDTKHLIAFARANNKVIIGPATVGGVQVRPRAREKRLVRSATEAVS